MEEGFLNGLRTEVEGPAYPGAYIYAYLYTDFIWLMLRKRYSMRTTNHVLINES